MPCSEYQGVLDWDQRPAALAGVAPSATVAVGNAGEVKAAQKVSQRDQRDILQAHPPPMANILPTSLSLDKQRQAWNRANSS